MGCNPSVTSRCSSLLLSASADVRSSDDAIAFEGAWITALNLLSVRVYQYGCTVYKRICAVIPVNLKMLNAFRIRTDL